MMAFRFELKLADGDDAGPIETNESNWHPGDTVIAHGNRQYRITAVVPIERIAEFVDRPLAGVLEIEALELRLSLHSVRRLPPRVDGGRPANRDR
jgi:hypothetical protein